RKGGETSGTGVVGRAILPAAGFPAGSPPERRRQPGLAAPHRTEVSGEPLAAGQPAAEAYGKRRLLAPRESAGEEVSREKPSIALSALPRRLSASAGENQLPLNRRP